MNLKCDNWSNQRTSLKNDSCQTSWKNTTNNILANYVFDIPATCTINQNYLCELGLNQQIPSLQCDKSTIETDFRNGCSGNVLTHTGARQNLDTRLYKTVPFMGECRAPLMDTDTYSILLSGESTRTHKSCSTQSSFERWEPLVPCVQNNIQNPKHFIPEYWVRGGLNTSSYYRNIDYLKACGIQKCKSQCQESFCPDIDVSDRIKRQKMQGMNLPCFPGSIPLRQY